MAKQSRISELASTIGSGTAQLDDYFKAHDLPSPSLSADATPDIRLPSSLTKLQNEILDATNELQALVEGPLGHLTRLTGPKNHYMMSLQAICRYKIASCFGIDEQVSFQEIAERCDIDESDVRRLLRMAITHYIFCEPRKGVVAHTAMSKLLAQNHLVSQWVSLVCEEIWNPTSRTIDAMMKWPGSQEPQHTGFALVNGESMFEAVARDVKRAERFADAMMFQQTAPHLDLSHLIKDLDWENEGCPKLLVDVGGSHGSICIEFLRRFPDLKCVVEDLPETISSASVPSDLVGRLEFKAHNFFTEQIVKNADVYFLRSILHDWSDKYAIQILRNLVPAMKNGTKVILNEICLPEPNTLPFYQEQVIRGMDLAMKQNFNSRERDADDLTELLRISDNRFKLKGIKCSPGSMLSVIEVVWEDKEEALKS